jgi:broad specificity phosphatase PhoE
VTVVVLVRHAEPLLAGKAPGNPWSLTDKGTNAAHQLGRSLVGRNPPQVVWTSPERRARETAAFAFPMAVTSVRRQLREVEKPWYDSSDEHVNAIASYLRGEAVEGWESR